MKKLFVLLLVAVGIGLYLYYIRGWTVQNVKDETLGKIGLTIDESATATPLGKRGTGTHWETAAPMLIAATGFGAAEIGGKIYVVGGIDGYGRILDTVQVYDILTDSWSYTTKIPQGAHHAAVATDGTKLYVIGGLTGLSGNPTDQVYAYDPTLREWSSLGKLNDFRGSGVAGVVNGRLFVTGGLNLAGPTGQTDEYEAVRGNWKETADMPTPRERAAAAVQGQEMFVFGGRRGTADGLSAAEAFAPSGKWRKLAAMPYAVDDLAAASLNGKLYVFGGENPSAVSGEDYEYDPLTDVWKTLPVPMTAARHGMAAVPYKDRIYLIGGSKRTGFSVTDLNEILFFPTKP